MYSGGGALTDPRCVGPAYPVRPIGMITHQGSVVSNHSVPVSFGQGLPKLHPFGLSPTNSDRRSGVELFYFGIFHPNQFPDPRTLAPLVRLSGTYQGSGISTGCERLVMTLFNSTCSCPDFIVFKVR